MPGGLSPLIAEEEYRDEKRGFSLTLPDGFSEDKETLKQVRESTAKQKLNYTAAFVDDSSPPRLILLDEMSGQIGKTTGKNLKKKFPQIKEVFDVAWKSHTLPSAVMVADAPDGKAVVAIAQVPLQPTAMQITVRLAGEDVEAAKELLQATIEGIEGNSNWDAEKKDTPPPNKRKTSTDRTVPIAIAATAFVAGLILLWLISKRLPKGALLVIAVVIFVVSKGLPEETADDLLARGTMTFFAFATGLLGLADLTQKKPKKKPTGDTLPE